MAARRAFGRSEQALTAMKPTNLPTIYSLSSVVVRLYATDAAFKTGYVQVTFGRVDLVPFQIHRFRRAQSMADHEQDRRFCGSSTGRGAHRPIQVQGSPPVENAGIRWPSALSSRDQ
jgi:hypothetical protein